MYKPYLLTLRNFQSFGNNTTVIRLDFDKPTMIVGRNHDSVVDGQLDSNGAGKTTILNGLTYANYDTLISGKGVKQDDIINNRNKKDMLVEHIFSGRDGAFYKIQRFRKHKELGGTGVNIFRRVGGTWEDEFTKDHDITTARDGGVKPDAAIVDAIGMPFEVFSRIVAFSASHTPFLTLPVGEQTEIVENIAGLAELTLDAEEIKKVSKADNTKLDRLREVNQTIKVQREQIRTQIESAVTRADALTKANQEEIKSTQGELATLSMVDFEEQIDFFEYVTKLEGQIAESKQILREEQTEASRTQAMIAKVEGWQTLQDQRIAAAKAIVDALEPINFTKEASKIVEWNALDKELSTLESELAQNRKDSTAAAKVVKERETELAHLSDAKCPYCTQQLLDAKSRVDSVTKLHDAARLTVDELVAVGEVLTNKIAETNDKLDKLSVSMKFTTEAKLNAAERQQTEARSHYERVLEEVNPFSDDMSIQKSFLKTTLGTIEKVEALIIKRQGKYDEYKALLTYASMKDLLRDQAKLDTVKERLQKLEAFVNPLDSTIADLKAVTLEETKDDEIALLEDDIEHQQFLIKLLTKKDSFIRKTLLQKSLPFMNTRLRYYLDRIGLPHKVGFQEDLSVRISQFNNTIGFGILSSGQKARINIALAFTFRDMLQLRHGRLNFCILDECLDVGLGNVGVQLTAKMIKQVAQDEKLSMFIISHRDEIANMFDRKLIIELKSGFSNVVEE